MLPHGISHLHRRLAALFIAAVFWSGVVNGGFKRYCSIRAAVAQLRDYLNQDPSDHRNTRVRIQSQYPSRPNPRPAPQASPA